MVVTAGLQDREDDPGLGRGVAASGFRNLHDLRPLGVPQAGGAAVAVVARRLTLRGHGGRRGRDQDDVGLVGFVLVEGFRTKCWRGCHYRLATGALDCFLVLVFLSSIGKDKEFSLEDLQKQTISKFLGLVTFWILPFSFGCQERD